MWKQKRIQGSIPFSFIEQLNTQFVVKDWDTGSQTTPGMPQQQSVWRMWGFFPALYLQGMHLDRSCWRSAQIFQIFLNSSSNMSQGGINRLDKLLPQWTGMSQLSLLGHLIHESSLSTCVQLVKTMPIWFEKLKIRRTRGNVVGRVRQLTFHVSVQTIQPEGAGGGWSSLRSLSTWV